MRHAEVENKEALTQRAGETAYEVWDAAYIQDKLTPQMQIRKIYVSGPPKMNIHIEAALEQVHSKIGLETH